VPLVPSGSTPFGGSIEPCHGRVHERIRNGHLPPPGYELVKQQIRNESENGQAVFSQYVGSPRLGGDFRELLSRITAEQEMPDVKWRHRGNFNFLERPIRTLRETSAYLCHESDRPVRVGQLAFYIAFAKHSAKIVPSQPAEVGREVRIWIERFLPEFDAYRNFKGTAEQARCVAAHIVAARLFFDSVEAAGQ